MIYCIHFFIDSAIHYLLRFILLFELSAPVTNLILLSVAIPFPLFMLRQRLIAFKNEMFVLPLILPINVSSDFSTDEML